MTPLESRIPWGSFLSADDIRGAILLPAALLPARSIGIVVLPFALHDLIEAFSKQMPSQFIINTVGTKYVITA